MNGQTVHDAMTTFVASQLARWEGRDEDADYLDKTYEGDQKSIAVGAHMLAAWLIACLSVERDETPAETARIVLEQLSMAEVCHGYECEGCDTMGRDEEEP